MSLKNQEIGLKVFIGGMFYNVPRQCRTLNTQLVQLEDGELGLIPQDSLPRLSRPLARRHLPKVPRRSLTSELQLFSKLFGRLRKILSLGVDGVDIEWPDCKGTSCVTAAQFASLVASTKSAVGGSLSVSVQLPNDFWSVLLWGSGQYRTDRAGIQGRSRGLIP